MWLPPCCQLRVKRPPTRSDYEGSRVSQITNSGILASPPRRKGRQHETFDIRRGCQCLQVRWAFEEPIIGTLNASARNLRQQGLPAHKLKQLEKAASSILVRISV